MSALIADYERERGAFDALCQPGCERRILLLRGVSGSGKTTLLRHCKQQAPGHITPLPIDLRPSSAMNVAEIFHSAGPLLSWERLARFTQQVAQMQAAPTVHVDSNWLAGINNRISVALHAESELDRGHRRTLLTDAWFADLAQFEQPLVLLFDHYEGATTEVKEWLAGPVLTRTMRVPRVRVVVAGQEVPDPNNIVWGDCCQTFDLYGVREAEHWLPVVRQLDLRLEGLDPRSYLAGLCRAFDGNPARIMDMLAAIKRQEAGQ